MATEHAATVGEEKTLFEGRPAAVDSLGRWILSIITVGIAALVWWFKATALHIRVTDQRLILRYGLFSRRTEYVELYRVTDLQVEEPFFERMCGYGRLAITSTDRDQPRVSLRGLKNPSQLADKIRACVEEQKNKRRVATIAEA